MYTGAVLVKFPYTEIVLKVNPSKYQYIILFVDGWWLGELIQSFRLRLNLLASLERKYLIHFINILSFIGYASSGISSKISGRSKPTLVNKFLCDKSHRIRKRAFLYSYAPLLKITSSVLYS